MVNYGIMAVCCKLLITYNTGNPVYTPLLFEVLKWVWVKTCVDYFMTLSTESNRFAFCVHAAENTYLTFQA